MSSWRAAILGGTVVALGAAAIWLAQPDSTHAPGSLRVVRRLNRPQGASPFDPVRLASAARQRWTAADIEHRWTRLGSGSRRTYRSPPIEASRGGLFAIVATFPDAEDRAALLLWSTGSVLTSEDFARNRRALRRASGERALVLRGDNLQPGGEPIQHLFIHLPDGTALSSAVETLGVLNRSDLTAHGPLGPVRLTEDGQVRDVVLTSSGQRVSYEIDVAGSLVSFGVRLQPDAAAELRAWQDTPSGETEIFAQSVSGGGWHDFTMPLAPTRRSKVIFEATMDPTAGAVTWSAPLLLAPDVEADRPNIILYVVDALRADALGLYGAREGRSPVIDTLGRDGLVFTRAYAAASWTKPSVTTLFTSLYPTTHGLGARFYSDPLPPTVVTLQDTLAADGYVTAQFSANPFTGTLSNLDKGSDVAVTPEAFLGGAPMNRNASISADRVHERALAWFAQHKRMRAFAYIQSVDTHPPFSVKGDTARAAYDASLAFVDAEIGRFREQLSALGFGDNTLFVLTADHGEAFGEHGRSGHGQSVYDEEVRVPLLLHWPGRIAPSRVDEPVHHVDLVPTILALAGITATDHRFQGRSLWPRSPQPRPSPVIVTRFVYPEDLDSPVADRTEALAIIDYPWKLIAFPREGAPARAELYRLDTDPGERRDLASVDGPRVKTLRAALDRFIADQMQQRVRFYADHTRGSPPPSTPPARDLLDQLRSLGYVR